MDTQRAAKEGGNSRAHNMLGQASLGLNALPHVPSDLSDQEVSGSEQPTPPSRTQRRIGGRSQLSLTQSP